MKGHGGYNSLDWPSLVQYFDIAVLGAGAAAPVAPAGTEYLFRTGTQIDYHKNSNALSKLAAEIPTRSATGVYAIQYDADFQVPIILNAHAEVYGTSGVWAQVASWNPATRTINVRVFNAAGAATDLAGGGTPDVLVVFVKARDTSSTGAGKT